MFPRTKPHGPSPHPELPFLLFPLLPRFQFYSAPASIAGWAPSQTREEPLPARTSRFRPAPPPSPSSARARPPFPPFSRSSPLAPFLPSASRLHTAPFPQTPGPPTPGAPPGSPPSPRRPPATPPFPATPPPPELPAPRLAILLSEPRAPPGPGSLASRSLAPSPPSPARPSLPAASHTPRPRPDLQWRPPSAAPRGQRATTEPPAAVAAAASTACALPTMRQEHFRGRA